MKEFNIIVFGDSITYGAWDYENAGWVNRLRMLLERKNDYYYNIFNLGIPGNTTIDIIKRFNFECKYRCSKQTNNIIIFQVGINDSSIINEKNNIYLDDFKNNIVYLIKQARKFTENILFLGLSQVDEYKVNPCNWDENIRYLNKEIVKFDKELEHICYKNKVAYLKIINLLKKEDLEDGLHPNNIGHKQLTDEVLNLLEKEWIGNE